MIDRGQAPEEWLVKAGLAEVIVFDLDGTLVDSDYANFLAYEDAVIHVLSKHIELDFSHSIRITRESLKEFIPNITDKQLEDIASYKERIYHKYLSKTKANSQLIQIIARSQGKEVVLATNSRRCRAELLLNHHGLIGKFSRKIFRGDEDQRDKYARLMADIPKERTPILIFENDGNAIELAIACGIGIDQIIDVRRARNE
jgi:beta-phosphoglucomutase